MPFEGVCRALYNYSPQSDEELEIKDGDLLLVLEKSTDDDWWKCKKKATNDDDDEPEGLVPNNYVQDIPPVSHAKALYEYTKQTDEEISFKEESQLDVYDESDPDWTLVGYNGQYGFAPAIYLEPVESIAGAPAPRVLAPPPMPTRSTADDSAIPGEADYPTPGSDPVHSREPASHTPAAQLAGIIAQRTGGTQPSSSTDQAYTSPQLPQRPQYMSGDHDDEPAPSLPQRPGSQSISTTSPPPRVQFAPPRSPEPPADLPSPPYNRNISVSHDDEYGNEALRSPGGFHLYNIHEMVQHMGKNKKMPMTLGINIGKGMIMISPEKSKDGPSREWTAEKLSHYSIEGKHVFMELVRPSKSIDFHAGAKDTAQEIVSALGDLAGSVRQEGLREILAASAGSGMAGFKKGQMLYEFMAQGEDEVTVAVGDEIIIMDDTKSEEWWMIRRMKNGKEGVVPSSYVEITGTIPHEQDNISGLTEARSIVEQNRLEEERLAKEAARKDKHRDSEVVPPERHSSLAGDTRRTSMRSSEKRGSKDQARSKPNTYRLRTWTDRSGTFKVEAEFIGLKEGKIHLHKVNGVKIAVPVTKMAVEDLEYGERGTGASLDDDKPLSDIKRRSTQHKKQSEAPDATRVTSGATVQSKEEHDWFDFFLQCGVNPQICERYANAFSKDQMTPDVLPEVNEKLLRTLGFKEGDIIRIMKHLDSKYDRKSGTQENGATSSGTEGGLFSGPDGVLRNNTRKGRPAPAVQTRDIIDENAFKQRIESPATNDLSLDSKATTRAAAPAKEDGRGFDDDAWDVKPSRAQTPIANVAASSSVLTSTTAPPPVQPKLINDDIASLSITAPPLQPTPASPQTSVQPAGQTQPPAQIEPFQKPVADQAIFDKIAALAPASRQQTQATNFQPAQYMQATQTGYQQQPLQSQQTAMPRQRPPPPAQQATTGGLAPPPRAASAPGFPPQQSGFVASPLQPQLTGYLPQQQFQPVQAQQTSFQPSQGFGQSYQNNGSLQTQTNGVQAMQQNYPALQPQPTGFQPQSQFGQQQVQQYGPGQPSYQQQLANGQQTGSPFADSARQHFYPTASGLSNSFAPQPTGFQPSFNISQPTGLNGFNTQVSTPPVPQLPQMPPQQTGGVFGPSQPLGTQSQPAPLMPQKTGPPPPVRFGVHGAKPLAPQPTGRANLAKATPQNPFGF